ncbi:hypothetical protein JCM33374_g2604 [Metschnikowia sp. JCM 33374]|nr:hypothetical protein JCM33374_g2604 [Metschnikowia sp. JCM 33374]
MRTNERPISIKDPSYNSSVIVEWTPWIEIYADSWPEQNSPHWILDYYLSYITLKINFAIDPGEIPLPVSLYQTPSDRYKKTSARLLIAPNSKLHSLDILGIVFGSLLQGSGLPTFRGSQGLWKNFNMIDLATPDAFYIDPGLVWQFYSWRRHQALQAQPNPGHFALAELSRNPAKDFVTITQNVDGLSGRAGHEQDKLFEIHGSLFELRCTSFTCTFVDRMNEDDPLTPALDVPHEYEMGCGNGSKDPKGPKDPKEYHAYAPDLGPLDDTILVAKSPQFTPIKELTPEELPSCPACGSLMRPGVVWFGESLPLRVLGAIDDFLEMDSVDLILVIGTSGTVYPANGYVELVRARGGAVAIFNTDIEPEVLRGEVPRTWGFLGDAAEWLPRVLECLKG